MATVQDFIAAMHEIAPPELAEDWDNTGLLLGSRRQVVTRALTCLTLTPDVAAEAVAAEAQLIITHHPILFRAVKRLTDDDAQGAMLQQLIRHGISVYAPHTSFDSGPEGINRQLADTLQLSDVRPLRPAPAPEYVKIVCFVPETDRLPVQRAMWDAGAGQIGEYSECSFRMPGIGTFHGSDASHPAVGTAGQFEEVEETRFETICPKSLVSKVVEAMVAAHPYEVPAYDVFRLDLPPRGEIGTGRFGRLPQPLPFGEFLDRCRESFGLSQVSYGGDLERSVQLVGVGCGAAGELLADAARHNCDAFVVGEARFHTYLEAESLGVGLVVIGHYASERPAVEALAVRLADTVPGVQVSPSQSERDPCRWK